MFGMCDRFYLFSLICLELEKMEVMKMNSDQYSVKDCARELKLVDIGPYLGPLV